MDIFDLLFGWGGQAMQLTFLLKDLSLKKKISLSLPMSNTCSFTSRWGNVTKRSF